VKIGSQPDPESFYITVSAAADLPKERTAPADEKAEDKPKAEDKAPAKDKAEGEAAGDKDKGK